MNQLQRFCVLLGAMLLVVAGCSTLKSTKIDNNRASDPRERIGICYSLPKAMIHIKAVKIDDEDKPAADKTTTEKATTEKAITEKTSSDKPADKTTTEKETTEKTTTEKAIADKPANGKEPSPSYDVTIETIYTPDPDNSFFLNPRLLCTSDDTFQIAVSNGLLTTVASTNTDQSGEVLVQLAKIGIESFKIAAGIPPGVKKNAGQASYPKQIEVTFDPSVQKDVDDAQERFVYHNGTNTKPAMLFELKVIPKPGSQISKSAQLTNVTSSFDGFVYRSVLPYTISLVSKKDESSISKTFLLPNNAPILAWSPKRAAGVKSINRVTLENGVLKEVYVDKPSTALAVTKVPLTILQSIVALPTDLIQLKLNYSSTNKSLVESQKNEITAMQQLLEAQRKLLEYQMTNTPPGKLQN
jgi:hypothetical protein